MTELRPPKETQEETVRRLKDPVWNNIRDLTEVIIKPQRPSKGFYYLARRIYLEIKGRKE